MLQIYKVSMIWKTIYLYLFSFEIFEKLIFLVTLKMADTD